jgi:hypothetical protein
MGTLADIERQRFGRLVVLRLAERGNYVTRTRYWICGCDCGKTVVVNGANLRHGQSQSCGCLRHELLAARNRTHGMSHTPEYRIWVSLRRRCEMSGCREYRLYGARGIYVASAWKDFSQFFADMGPMPVDTAGRKRNRYSIERIDNDGPYAPWNCRWATQADQVRNSRRARSISFNGATKTLRDWALVVGVTERTLAERLTRWTLEKALSTPKIHRRPTRTP